MISHLILPKVNRGDTNINRTCNLYLFRYEINRDYEICLSTYFDVCINDMKKLEGIKEILNIKVGLNSNIRGHPLSTFAHIWPFLDPPPPPPPLPPVRPCSFSR